MVREINNSIECKKKHKLITLIYRRRNTHLTIKLRATLISYVLKNSPGINIPIKKIPLTNQQTVTTTTTTTSTITTTTITITTTTLTIVTSIIIIIHVTKKIIIVAPIVKTI